MQRWSVILAWLTILLPVTVDAGVPTGTARYVARDRAANRAEIAAGVEAAIAGLSFLIRPFARRRLRVDKFDIASVQFRVSATAVSIAHDDHITRSARGSKRVRTWEDGELVWVSQRVLGDRIEQVFEMGNGALELSYRFADDASSVTIHAVLRSPKLPTELRYHLVFDRAP